MLRKFLMVGLLAALAFPASAKIQSSPIGARSLCGDGMYSTVAGSGGCSHHGGFVRNLTETERTGRTADSTSSPYNTGGGNSGTSTPVEFSETGTMPTTGGAPLSIMVLGSLLSLSAFYLRRRVQ